MQATSLLRRASAATATLRKPATFLASGPSRFHLSTPSCHSQTCLRTLSTTPPLDPAPTDSEASIKADREEVIKIKSSITIEEKILPAEHHEHRPHHPGRSDIDHLDDPTTSEELVHADRHPVSKEDLLKQGQGKRGFSTSARARSDEGDPQHLDKSGLPFLEKPTLSEEIVHADRFPEDPRPKKNSVKVEVKWDETMPPVIVKMGTQAVEPEEAVHRGDVSDYSYDF
ncbi:hypothetical protein RQP46_008869 [Phenoliferia psychrophenolica]